MTTTAEGLEPPRSWSGETRSPEAQQRDARSKRRFLVALVIVNGAVPVTLLAIDAIRGVLGVDGVNYAIRTTGWLGLLFLTLALVVTPVRELAKWPAIASVRRTLGLYGFFHILVHFTIFFGFDRLWSVSSTVNEIFTRTYLLLGTIALILMIPLAVTSMDRMISLVGPKRWKLLHRLAYPITILGVIHYYLLVKADVRQPILFGVVVGGLLVYRGGRFVADRRKRARRPDIAVAPMKRKFWSGKLTVARIFEETHDVKTFRLALDGGLELPFSYEPGQYLNLALTIDGKRVPRSYTIASSPTRAGFVEITVKREPHGTSSRFLHDTLREGSALDVSAPAGKFVFTGTRDLGVPGARVDAEQVVLIAGGVGVTPLMSILRFLADRSWKGRVYFIYAARTEKDLIFRDELAYLVRRMPDLRATVTLTREPEGSSWTGARGRITKELLAPMASAIVRSEVYVCGPDEMMNETKRVLLEMGLPPKQFHQEAFVSPSSSEDAPADQAESGEPVPALVTFTRSGRSLEIAPDQTLLDAAETCGVDIPSECRSGICGQCKTRVADGRVRMDAQDALTKADRANGLVLACQARALSDLSVDA
ncbi:MAG: FAD-binding oxidoreductase [Polyangiaceae bacterium]